jgi:hypothetical protein
LALPDLEKAKVVARNSLTSGSRQRTYHRAVTDADRCGRRRSELLSLRLESVQQREKHWGFADLCGKGGHVHTVPVFVWVKAAVGHPDHSGGHRAPPGVSRDQQGGTRVGRRHVTQKCCGTSCAPRLSVHTPL